ncbi:pilus assembly protein TadG-related protein [Edaphobacter aggregans]|uniref:pilus assembly protein TadG-related protein n=1 Tax=Edaphobacter aggregans TaxID=570835 RepID=UPI000554D1B2|nr:pilus assembly protein TadG-related protein [Edaphobacter aggregans]
MRFKEEDGQAILIVALAMSIFLIGAVGLAVDGAHLYSQRQMAQSAADAAAQAAMMSIKDATSGAGANSFVSTPGSSFTCGTTDARTPCLYAKQNGFGGSASDTVTIDFPTPPATAAPGVNFSSAFPTVLVRATVQRNVDATLIRMVGAGATTTVTARAMAAIVDVFSPVPILVNHPTLPGSFHTNGGVDVQIFGGPSRSVEVNSSSSTAVTTAGSGTVDLSHAGPTSNGADFGVWGGPSPNPSFIFLPGTLPGHYVPGASWMQDPLKDVDPPDPATLTLPDAPLPVTLDASQSLGPITCPASAGPHGCTVLSPGVYKDGFTTLKNTTALFKPGIYYIRGGGFKCQAGCSASMVTGTADPSPPDGTGTGWDGTEAGGGMLVYNTGPTGDPTNADTFELGANGSINLIGSPSSSAYQGILFFQDRASDAHTGNQAHKLGGGGDLTLIGTLYLTNTRATMLGDTNHYQEVQLQGNPGSATNITGEIIVDVLGLGGNAGITMTLSPVPSVFISQVALVN